MMRLIFKFQQYLETLATTNEPRATEPPRAIGEADESCDDHEEDKPLVGINLPKRLKKKP